MSRNVQRAICFCLIIGILGSSTLSYVSETATFAQGRKKNKSSIINSEPRVTNLNWNYHMIHAIPAVSERKQAEKVKVAIIDSGVNYSDDINVYERKNFIPGEEELSVLYEDFSGHGTSVAGIIAAKDNQEGITGINSNVELYSARVLDSKNKAPIHLVVQAIEWAVEKKVNIINLSFTTSRDSKELRKAVERAYDAGILLIASTANKGKAEYPAAYDCVMAVGAVDSNGNVSTFSSSNNQIEITAPGEKILSTDVFDTLSVHSGTSLAAAHVTGVASLLWEKDIHVNNDYIRCVLDLSANLYGKKEAYGFGLVDYEYAKEVFELLRPMAQQKERYKSLMRRGLEQTKNPKQRTLSSYGDVDSVEGAWCVDAHNGTLGDYTFTNAPNGRAYLLAGCTLPDRSAITALQGIVDNPYFHGNWYYGSDTKDERNYFASYLYLTEIASAMVQGKKIPEVPTLCKAGKPNAKSDYKDSMEYISHAGVKIPLITETYVNRRKKIKWTDIEQTIQKKYAKSFDAANSVHKGLIVYGMAMHHVGDLFAHSSVMPNDTGIGHIISHAEGADEPRFVKQRYTAAKLVIKNMLSHLDKEHVTKSGTGTLKDFALNMNYGVYFYVRKFRKYAGQICDSDEYKEEFMYQYLFLSDPWEDETKLGLVKRQLMK